MSSSDIMIYLIAQFLGDNMEQWFEEHFTMYWVVDQVIKKQQPLTFDDFTGTKRLK